MAQLIQGTNILLYTGSSTETVSNVLVGEPTSDGKGFTLGIPKGDTHTWYDRKIGFFGRVFRTVGYPEEGIEANIPLCWHKKVHVQLLDGTSALTVYEKNTYTKHVFYETYYCDNRGEKTLASGIERTDDVTVRIYSFSHNNSYIPKVGDMFISGESSFTFDTTSQQTISASMATFKQNNPGYAFIKSVNIKDNGALPDIDIIGR